MGWIKSGIFAAALLLFTSSLYAQNNIGLPEIRNFSHEATMAGAQNWQICQDRFGNLHFANNSGLLSYNGKEWKLHPLPNKTIVRSLALAPDDRIYVGGQDAFGYFFPDKHGNLQYHSLIQLVPSNLRTFGDVWKILVQDSMVYFRTTHVIFRLDPARKALKAFMCKAQSRWTYMAFASGHLYAQGQEEDLVVLQNEQWLSIPSTPLHNSLITAILPLKGNELLIASMRNGCFVLKDKELKPFALSDQILKARIYTAVSINENTIALGTVSDGIYFINSSGEIIRHFSTHNGMQNNNVRTLFTDKDSTLWAGLEEGIDQINYKSAIQKILPVLKNPIPAYAISIFHHHLYIGTSDGLYQTGLSVDPSADISLSEGHFEHVQNSDGQVWNLSELNGRLLMGHHEGAFIILDNSTRQVNKEGGGAWLFRELPDSNKIISGTYSGIQVLKKTGNGFTALSNRDNPLKESLRFVEIDYPNHIVWASHPYRGIYQLKMSDDFENIQSVTLFTSANGLPGNVNNFVFKVNDEIIFATENGIYEFDPATQTFKISPKYRPILGNTSVKFMVSDARHRIWLATEKRMGVIENDSLTYLPEFDGKLVAGFEHIYPYNDRNILIGGYNGIFHLNYESYKQKRSPIKARITKVISTGSQDSLLMNDYFVYKGKLYDQQNIEAIESLAPGFNSFHFEFASNEFRQANKILYSYMLEGFDRDWSAWNNKTDKDYTNLPYGKYRFLVRARDNLDNVSPLAAYSFEILPRWYQTKGAYLTYIAFFVLLILLMSQLHQRRMEMQKRKFEKEEAQLKYLHELELEHNEREIIKLKNDRLETEVMYKNQQLASTTMHLYKRGRLLAKIKEELSTATDKLINKEDKSDFIKLLKLISGEEKKDNDWEQFSIHFDQVHNSFLQKIKNAYPELTQTDLKICAYVKMNLSSKEIAQLLNISLKGVEIGRYRLRKKLSLSPEINLNDFIGRFE